jgi:hypothetical protein
MARGQAYFSMLIRRADRGRVAEDEQIMGNIPELLAT